MKSLLREVKHVCLTTDCWTSRSQEGFMTVTCHFLDHQWSSKSVVLDTSPVLTPTSSLTDDTRDDADVGHQGHTAEALSSQLGQVITHWELTGKVSAVVHDNAANVKDMGQRNNTLDVGCAAHKLQLSINKGLDVSRQIQTAMGGVSRLVGHFRRSTNATKALEQKQTSMNVPNIDWSSR